VYPKDSPFFFDTVGDALRYLRGRGQEVERGIQDNLREAQFRNKDLDELHAELEETGTVDFFKDQ
jgi:hypothetical protein